MTAIKASEALAVVLQLAKDQPGNTAKCVYFNPDQTPCCIVGHGLAALGANPDMYLADSELNKWTEVYALASKGYLVVDDDKAVDYLYEIQTLQDKGYTWGDAVATATDRIKGDADE